MAGYRDRKLVVSREVGGDFCFLHISCSKFVFQRVRRFWLEKSSQHITMEPESLNHSDVSSADVSEPMVLMSDSTLVSQTLPFTRAHLLTLPPPQASSNP